MNNKITRRNFNILCERIGIEEKPKTYREIGDKYDITRERAKQVCFKTIFIIEKILENDNHFIKYGQFRNH